MKTINYLLIVLSVLLMNSCKKTETTVNPLKKVSASLNGENQIPVVNTAATGAVSGTYNSDTKILNFTLSFQGVTPTAIHIHKGFANSTGPVVLGFSGALISPYVYTSPALTSSEESDLLAGAYYVNVHSSNFSSGEIRGQLNVQ